MKYFKTFQMNPTHIKTTLSRLIPFDNFMVYVGIPQPISALYSQWRWY